MFIGLKSLKIFFYGLSVISFLWAEKNFISQNPKHTITQFEISSESSRAIQLFLVEPSINEENESHSSRYEKLPKFSYQRKVDNQLLVFRIIENPNFLTIDSILLFSLGSRAPPIC
jgi:hypothetical protein